jgi:FkbM family methyltransferase
VAKRGTVNNRRALEAGPRKNQHPLTRAGGLLRHVALRARTGLTWFLERINPRLVLRRAMTGARPARNSAHAALKLRYQRRRLRQFISPHLAEGELAFDIGANVGDWTEVMSGLGARVVAVEPQEGVAETLRDRFAADPQVSVVCSAVGEAPGTGLLHPAGTASQHSSMSDEWRAVATEHRGVTTWHEPTEVRVTTLDALIAEFGRPAFAKVDVEGYELQVLAGLNTPLDAITFEFHRETLDELSRCIERIGELGAYRFELYVDEWPDRVTAELSADQVLERAAALPPGSWGMAVARRDAG